MKDMMKSIATNLGIGVPFLILLYFANPTLFMSLNYWQCVALGIIIPICKDLAIWGLKK